MNRLQHETSPYLLQHAANPVDWYPWGEEALERAQAEDKPIIVSIGYSTCHWCHVMERESFESEEVAAFMNEHFVCIKVDREERPDVDQVYMEACQAISGGGGWPLNAILLPDTKPFYAGTYFPPQSAHNRPGWLDLLGYLHKIYTEDREKVNTQAAQLTSSIAKSAEMFIKPVGEDDDPFHPAKVEEMLTKLRGRFDLKNGGFGGAPKFPMSQSLELLLDYGLLNEHENSVTLAVAGMRAMIDGGIYDQLGGGFSRYTVDAGWRVPHFEKMLYDNALLLRLLGKLEMRVPAAVYRKTIEETVNWLEREMLSPGGSFYAALDADSEGVEGKFYVWDHDELAEVLSEFELTQVQSFWGSSKAGNWTEEATNIFYRSEKVPVAMEETMTQIKEKLFAVRAKRIRPGRDEKVILQWNALMISGLTYCYRATQEDRYLELAENALAALRKELYHAGKWYRNFKDGQRGQPAYLDDHAALLEALLDLYQVNFNNELLLEARELVHYVEATFGGAPGGLYYLRPKLGNELPVATLDLYDNALPSGNSQMLHNLQRMGQLTGATELMRSAAEKLTSISESVQKYPSSFANWGRLALQLSRPVRELVITGPGSKAAAREIQTIYRPNLGIVVAETDPPDFANLKDRYLDNRLQFFLCENQSCKLPVSSVAELSLD